VLAIVLAPGCKSQDNTKIVVAVWSDLVVPTELDTVRIDVTGPTGKSSDSFPLTTGAGPGKTKLPVELALVPTGAKNATFTVTAVGLHNQTEIVTQTARVSFVSGQALLLKLFLGRACAGMTCPAEYTCSAGSCGQPVAVATLPPYDPSKPLVGPDAAVSADTAPPSDARVLDVSAPDSRGIDTGSVDTGQNPDVPLGSGGTGGGGGSGGTGGTGGAGGTTGVDGPRGTGGAPGVDAPPVDAASPDLPDVPLIAVDGAGGAGGGGDGGLVTIDAANPDVGDAVSSDVADVPMQTCVFGSSVFGNCKFGP
jgi:hypothetical protein